MNKRSYYETAMTKGSIEKVMFDPENKKDFDKTLSGLKRDVALYGSHDDVNGVLKATDKFILLNTYRVIKILNKINEYLVFWSNGVGPEVPKGMNGKKLYLVYSNTPMTINSKGSLIRDMHNTVRVNLYSYLKDKKHNMKLDTIYINLNEEIDLIEVVGKVLELRQISDDMVDHILYSICNWLEKEVLERLEETKKKLRISLSAGGGTID